jgi:hypothetical protein
MRWMKISCVLALVALAVFIGGRDSSAHHMTLRANLEEITLAADRVFVGRCVAIEETEEEIAQGTLDVTRYTFEVERAIKGKLPRRVTFTQLGHPSHRSLGKGGEITMHGSPVTPGNFLHGMAEYRVGDRMVLFLVKDYLGGKVTKPVADDQGAFYVSKMPSGQELVRNNLNNTGLFTTPYNNLDVKASDAKVIFPDRDEPISAEPQGKDRQVLSAASVALADKRGALPLDAFLEVVERIVSAHGIEKGVVNQ